MTQEAIIWGWVYGLLGASVGIIGGILGAWNSRRVRKGEESWLTLARWNPLDWFNFLLIVIGCSFLIAGLIFRWSNASLGALNIGTVFSGVGAFGWISRARALMNKGSS